MTPEEELLTAQFGRKIFIEYDKEDDLATLLTLSYAGSGRYSYYQGRF